jgi:hypothetical protein
MATYRAKAYISRIAIIIITIVGQQNDSVLHIWGSQDGVILEDVILQCVELWFKMSILLCGICSNPDALTSAAKSGGPAELIHQAFSSSVNSSHKSINDINSLQ